MGRRLQGSLLLGLACCVAFVGCEDRDPIVPGGEGDAGDAAAGSSASGTPGEAGNRAGGAGGADDGTDEPIPLEELLEPLVAAQCSRTERCVPPFAEWIPGGCAADQRRRLANGEFAAVAASVEIGTVVYDPALAPACITAWRELPCDHGGLIAECGRAIAGTVPLGSDCTFSIECSGEAHCAGCPGRCVARPELGEECEAEVPCAGGNRCDASGRCSPFPFIGEACNQSVDDYVPCRNSACVGEVGGAGTCQPYRPLPLGSECNVGPGVYCDEGSCALVASGQDGGAESRCVEESLSGGPCAIGFDDTCPFREVCVVPDDASDPLTGTCEALPGLGERCSSGDDCGPEARCSLSGTCEPVSELGSECRFDVDCHSGDCADGRCVLLTNCSTADPEVRDRVCPTRAPFGTVFDGFDDDTSVPLWVVDDDPNDATSAVSHTAEDGFSCEGALRVDIPEPAYAGTTTVSFDTTASGSGFDWSGRSALHVWIKLVEPVPGDSAHVEALYFGIDFFDEAAGTGHWALASPPADNDWHEVVFPLDDERIDQIRALFLRVEHLEAAPEGGLATPPALVVLVDDVWVE